MPDEDEKPDLGILLGVAPKGPSKGGPKGDGEAGDLAYEEFAAHASEAFPDMDETQISALKRAIESCVASYNSD